MPRCATGIPRQQKSRREASYESSVAAERLFVNLVKRKIEKIWLIKAVEYLFAMDCRKNIIECLVDRINNVVELKVLLAYRVVSLEKVLSKEPRNGLPVIPAEKNYGNTLYFIGLREG